MTYLDYAKAFNKVNHGVLLNKLKTFGICGKLGEWLHSFLTNRRHHVRIPGGVSKSDSPTGYCARPSDFPGPN